MLAFLRKRQSQTEALPLFPVPLSLSLAVHSHNLPRLLPSFVRRLNALFLLVHHSSWNLAVTQLSPAWFSTFTVIIATLFKSTQHSQWVCQDCSPGPGTRTTVRESESCPQYPVLPLPLTMSQSFCKAPFSPSLHQDMVPTSVQHLVK